MATLRAHSEQNMARGARQLRSRRLEAAEAAAKLPDILRALIEEHIYQMRVVRMLERQVALLNQRQQPDYEVMHGVMRYMTGYPDRFHHPKEDLVFRKVVQRDPSSRPQVKQLLREHEQVIAHGAELMTLIERCRADSGTADTDALRKSAHSYIGHLRRHMDVEELHFFPHAQRVLRASDWADVDARMQPILDPVFGESVAPEFRRLRAQEVRKPDSVARRAARRRWVRAVAAVEAVSALVAGATLSGLKLSRHNRQALGTNAAILRELLGTQPSGARAALMREAWVRNAGMAKDIRRQLSDVWSEAFAAAWQACRAAGTPEAKASEAMDRLRRIFERPSVENTSPAR